MSDHHASNDDDSVTNSARPLAIRAGLSVALLWVAQPPWMLWPFAMIALVPWLQVAMMPERITKRGYMILWSISTLYWLVSLQGLRHSHPGMYFCWMALAGYLAVYHVLFIGVVRNILAKGFPLILAAPVAWIGQECLRNYLLTGISAVMLGHSVADVPAMIQIADLFGTYGVSFLLVLINVAAFLLFDVLRRNSSWKSSAQSWSVALLAVVAAIGYGTFRLQQPIGDSAATFALIQRNEPVEYGQSVEREIEMFQNYASQSVNSVRAAGKRIDAVVWPESMFSGDAPWMIVGSNAKIPDVPGMPELTAEEFRFGVQQRRDFFLQRARHVLNAIASASESARSPQLLAGCGVVRYAEIPEVYSGVVSIKPDGSFEDWYGKTHLVMFGEYIPIAPSIPGLRSLVPPGMGLQTGPGAKRFMVGEMSVAPNICIETAVERVTVNHLASLRSQNVMADVIVTVTNDGWFDESSVIEHHLRCGQLVAVACRRPILSAANNGPTVWIDSCGRIVDRLATGTNGAVIATPKKDDRISLYLRIGDWPARICVLLCAITLFRRKRQSE